MGLFSFIGKAAKAVGKLVGGPVGGALRLGGGLLDHKGGITAHTAVKMGTMGYRPQIFIARAKSPSSTTASVLRESPVLPGGAIATRSGTMPQNSETPPRSFSGSGGATGRKRRKPSRIASGGSKRRRSSGRKLKFGSPAWQAKYGRKKKRRGKRR